jgi:cell division protein FtsZ
MTDQPSNEDAPTNQGLGPRISVIGVGGAGGNAINNMIRANLEGVEFLAANADAQALDQSLCENQIQLGASLTKGLGAGSRPEIGQAAAEEANEAIANALRGANMIFITAGMGGGTGTGAAPVIAKAAREQGVLTVGVVSKPFEFEGAHRMRQAEQGIAELTKYVDTLIVIPNQNLFRIADEKTTFADAFKLADEVLHSGVRGVTDLMVLPGLVNLDFADVHSVMAGMGKAVMGTGEAEGDDRALAAAQAAVSNPLLDEISMQGARSVLINITGGLDLMLMEVDAAANHIRAQVDPDANIIFGSAFNENLDGKIRVSVIATGNDLEHAGRLTPKSNTPFVNHLDDNSDMQSATSTKATGAMEQTATAEEPLTLRLVSTLPATSQQPDVALVSDPASDSTPEQELTIPPRPMPARPSPNWETSAQPKSPFHRPAKPVKSESILEAFKNRRMPEEEAEPATESPPGLTAENMHYVVWEVGLGARIYKVPEGKLALIGHQPHADRLKLFDNLGKAKAEANAVFKRVTAERTAKGLSRSILEPTLEDIMGWDEDKVPQYFL